jgi:cytochrome P450
MSLIASLPILTFLFSLPIDVNKEKEPALEVDPAGIVVGLNDGSETENDCDEKGRGELGEESFGVTEIKEHLLLLLTAFIPKAIASVITNLCYCLSFPENASVLNKLREVIQELDATGPDGSPARRKVETKFCTSRRGLYNSSEADDECNGSLEYIDAVLCEICRLYPPAMGSIRVLKEDIKIGGIDVPTGWNVFIPLYAAHRDPALWDRPESFNPERFVDPESRRKIFLDSATDSCPTRPLLVMLLRMFTIQMLRRFTWTPVVDPRENVHKLFPVPRPIDKFRVRLTRYSSAI